MVESNILQSFLPNKWESLSVDAKAAICQAILNYTSGTDKFTICFTNLGGQIKGRCFPFFHEVEMDEGLISNTDSVSASQVAKAVFYVCHEGCHVKQYNDLEEGALESKDIIFHNNVGIKDCNNNYIVGPKTEADIKLSLLYQLQPIEREAWDFANKRVSEFISTMNELFPEQFQVKGFSYFDFDETIEMARMVFISDDPIHDIDNILLTMSGLFVDEPLNEIMCDVIRNTQSIDMVKRLDANQTKNLQHAEEIHCKQSEATLSDEEIEDLFHDRE